MVAVSGAQFIESLCFLKIERVEAFGETAIVWSEMIASLLRLALVAPEPGHAHGRAKFAEVRSLLGNEASMLFSPETI